MPSALQGSEEKLRLAQLRHFEERAESRGFKAVAGIDEAGRGPLAGPVVAACCSFSKGFSLPGVDDSKKLTPKRREALFRELTSSREVAYAYSIADSLLVDEINILQATIHAMRDAVDKMVKRPDYLLVDGLELPHAIPGEGIIKGDERSQLIASASIIAKVLRDKLMLEYHERWPHYGFDRHKGYGTAAHIEAIEKFGPCPIHRRSFEPIKSMVACSS